MSARRVAVRIAYNGKGFSGSQRQPGLRTVEGEVLRALEAVMPRMEGAFELKAASRTDAGVSAAGNVIAFRSAMRDGAELLRALNAVSGDVHFLAVAELPEERNIRHAASRRYRYFLPKEGIDIEAARACAPLFEGEHDFRRFCRDEGKGTVTIIDSINVSDECDMLVIEFIAPRFLWNMVRRIVAAIAAVAEGARTMSELERALQGEDLQFGLAPAENLVLMDVEYHDLAFVRHDDPVLHRKIAEGLHRSRVDLSLLLSVRQR